MLALVPKGTLALHAVESLSFLMVWALKRPTFMRLCEWQCQGYWEAFISLMPQAMLSRSRPGQNQHVIYCS